MANLTLDNPGMADRVAGTVVEELKRELMNVEHNLELIDAYFYFLNCLLSVVDECSMSEVS